MSSSFLEIIELDSGEIVLQRADEDGGPLVTIRFSPESEQYLADAKVDVARAMIQAGIETAARMSEQIELQLENEDETPQTLH